MKKFYCILIALLIVSGASAQNQQPCSSCLPEGITFSTQAQVDSFQINYPNCTEIEGDVVMSGSAITNLIGLQALDSIKGNLRVELNDVMINFSGLENLIFIGGNLDIWENHALISMKGLDGLTWVGGGFSLFGCYITSLSDLNKLTHLGGGISICYEYSLPDLKGLEGLSKIGGDLYLVGDTALISLSGLEGLDSIAGSVTFTTSNGDYPPTIRLKNLSGLDNLTYIGGDLTISENHGLNSLTGLDNLTSVGGDLSIISNALYSMTGLENLAAIGGNLHIGFWEGGNPNLTTLTGLEGLTSVGGDLSIFRNDLTSLTGLESLTSIGGDIWIIFNDALTSLSGLDNLTSIEGDLWIDSNYSLTSLTGLDSIDAGSISNLAICKNTSLSTCDVKSVCDYLANPNGRIEIYENGTDCNSPEIVKAACGLGIKDNGASANHLFLYPNPPSTTFTVELSYETVPKNTLLNIFNLNGQQLMERQITEPTTVIDVGTLPGGVYVVRLVWEKGVQVGKFVKK